MSAGFETLMVGVGCTGRIERNWGILGECHG